MGTSSITITALTATPTLRGNKLKATVSATGPAANIPTLMTKTVVFLSSTTNDYTTATEIARGNPEALDAGLIEEQTYYYWAYALDNSDSPGAVFPVSPTGGVACTAIGMSGLAFGLANGKIRFDSHDTDVAVASGALRVAVKTTSGNDPSDADPVFVAMPGSTLTIGDYSIRRINAALALTISAGSTLGVDTVSAPFRIRAAFFDDAGTLRIAVRNSSAPSGVVFPLPDDGVLSAVADNGAGGSDLIDTFYAAVAIASKPYRLIAYADWSSGLATPGTWTARDIVRLAGHGGIAPGKVVQTVPTNLPGYGGSSTSLIPWDDTIPQISEGIGLFTINLTPRSQINVFFIQVGVNVAHSVASEFTCALFRDVTANAIAATFGYVAAADKPTRLTFEFVVQAGDIAARDYKIRVGAGTVGTTTLNGVAAASKLGGVQTQFIRIEELFG